MKKPPDNGGFLRIKAISACDSIGTPSSSQAALRRKTYFFPP